VAVDSLAQAWPTGSAGGRAESSHEEFVAACLLCEVAARESREGRAVSALPGSGPRVSWQQFRGLCHWPGKSACLDTLGRPDAAARIRPPCWRESSVLSGLQRRRRRRPVMRAGVMLTKCSRVPPADDWPPGTATDVPSSSGSRW
jgi:hypothetical protein